MYLESNDILDGEGDFRRALAERNGFTEGELAENHRYRIAPTQVSRLWGAALEPLRASLTALLGWLLFLFVLITLCPAPLFAAVEWLWG